MEKVHIQGFAGFKFRAVPLLFSSADILFKLVESATQSLHEAQETDSAILTVNVRAHLEGLWL